jgi:hypothetical protein
MLDNIVIIIKTETQKAYLSGSYPDFSLTDSSSSATRFVDTTETVQFLERQGLDFEEEYI